MYTFWDPDSRAYRRGLATHLVVATYKVTLADPGLSDLPISQEILEMCIFVGSLHKVLVTLKQMNPMPSPAHKP